MSMWLLPLQENNQDEALLIACVPGPLTALVPISVLGLQFIHIESTI